MSSNKGITLVVLVITIILLLILSGTAVYVGNNTMQNAAEQRFLNQLQEINEAVNMHSDDYENLNLTAEEHTEDNITYNYVLSTETDFNKIGLYNITDTVYANFKDGQVYSKEGINGKHTLKDFGIEYYKPTSATIWEDFSGNKINGTLVNNIWNEKCKKISKAETIIFENTEEIQNINIEQIITNTNYNLIYKDGKYTFTANDDLDLYCFRIYNRELTEIEKQQNYNIDKIRYNISE